MKNAGVDIFSSGNHLWDRKESLEYIKKETCIAKPLNYPKAAFGFESVRFVHDNEEIILFTLCGQAFMSPVDSPFFALEKFLDTINDLNKIIIVDFHAESTAEKKTFAYYFDGRVTAILGTHTHVQTADERILSGGTAYITDLGMTGITDSVIGMDPKICVERARKQIFFRMKPLEENDSKAEVHGIIAEINANTGKTESIRRI